MGYLTPQMYGAVADSNGTTGTDNLAAFNAWLAACLSSGNSGFIPAGWYYCSGPLNPIVTTTFQGGFSIKGEWIATTYQPNQKDTRIFWNATHGAVFLSFSGSTSSDSYDAIFLQDFVVQASNTTHGLGIGIKTVGVRPYLSRIGSIFHTYGVNAENADLMRTDGCYIVRNKAGGILTEAIFEYLDTASTINDNNSQAIPGSSPPYTGFNLINVQGSYAQSSFGHTFIRTNFNGGPGVSWDSGNELSLIECELESNGDGTGAVYPCKIGYNGPVTNLRIINCHFQSQPIWLDNVLGGRIESTSPVYRTSRTGNVFVEASCNPAIGPTTFPSNYSITRGVTAIAPNFLVDGGLVHDLPYGTGATEVPAPVVTQTGTLAVTTSLSTPLIPGRRFLVVSSTGAATAGWANNAGSYGLSAGTYLFVDVICRNGAGAAYPTLELGFVDSASVANFVTIGALNSVTGYQLVLPNGWVQFSIPVQIPATGGFGNLKSLFFLLGFSGTATWEVAYAGLGLSPQPRMPATASTDYNFVVSASSSSPRILAGVAAAGYLAHVTNMKSLDAVAAIVSGNDYSIQTSATSPPPDNIAVKLTPKCTNAVSVPGG